MNKIENCKQFLIFGLVGLSNTIISYLIYSITLIVLRKVEIFPTTDYLIAQLSMFILSVLWSFYWNNKMVFARKSKRNILISLLKTYISYAFVSLFLSGLLLTFWINILNISEFIAPIFNLIITVPLNFIIQKYWVYRS